MMKSVIETVRWASQRGAATARRCFFSLVFVVPAIASHADTFCKTDLSYSWKKTGEGVDRMQLVRSVESSGPTEESARESIAVLVSREHQRALGLCRERHENLSGCVANRFTQSQPALIGMSFSARKALEEAITSDCQSQQGQCGQVSSSEILCKERIASTEAAGESEKEKAGEKKPAEKETKEKEAKKK